MLAEKKDADFASKRKHIEVQSMNGDVLSINIVDFLRIVAENKFAENNFYDKWRMIQ